MNNYRYKVVAKLKDEASFVAKERQAEIVEKLEIIQTDNFSYSTIRENYYAEFFPIYLFFSELRKLKANFEVLEFHDLTTGEVDYGIET